MNGILGKLAAFSLPGAAWMWEAGAIITIVIGVGVTGFVKGIKHQQTIDAAAQSEQKTVVITKIVKQVTINAGVSESAAKERIRIETVYKTITKEVPVHVQPSDTACNLSNGWVLSYNAAASGSIPTAPPGIEKNPSGITATQVLEDGVIPAYEEYRQCRAQVIQFNEWYDQQAAVFGQTK